ncbi:hypothetical protein KC878_02160 [Candidatus Saccharibacteria bacterium]|nr:hypothetical protein [Candidatus Saccharibacteria bacterium]MCB9820999.1 hypothetical protein [Candidatus Nomurabacteria bacterium]
MSSVLIVSRPKVQDGSRLNLNYKIGDYEHTIRFDFFRNIPDTQAVTSLLNWLALTYATYIFDIEFPDVVDVEFALSDAERIFFEKLYDLGMREFKYLNKIEVSKTPTISSPSKTQKTFGSTKTPTAQKVLLMNGGGKDGVAGSVILDLAGVDFSWFSVNPGVSQLNIVNKSTQGSVNVKRAIGRQTIWERAQYKGHKPTSSGLAIIGLLTALIYDYTDIVTSNEQAANEATIIHNGFAVNHQYTKSAEFEQDLQALCHEHGINIRYWSILRPLKENEILKIIERHQPASISQITSCNHGFLTGTWCLNCTKCAFVALSFATYAPIAYGKIWPINRPLDNLGIVPSLKDLLEADKPFECIGTSDELTALCQDFLSISADDTPAEVMNIINQRASRPRVDLEPYDPKHYTPDIPKNIIESVTKLVKKLN